MTPGRVIDLQKAVNKINAAIAQLAPSATDELAEYNAILIGRLNDPPTVTIRENAEHLQGVSDDLTRIGDELTAFIGKQ